MANEENRQAQERHEKARDKGEEALEALAKGKPEQADQKIQQAKDLDPSALEELVEDLDEDAGSDPKAATRGAD